MSNAATHREIFQIWWNQFTG